MGRRKISEWLLAFWFFLFVGVMVAETIYLHYTGTVYVLDYDATMVWVESWGVFAYLIDVVFFYFCYRLVRRYRRNKAESSNSRSDP